jgi:hypothetical protein
VVNDEGDSAPVSRQSELSMVIWNRLLLAKQGVDMFARTVRMQLKPNSVPEFTQLIEREVIPLLRKQQGFQDEITFVPSEGREAVGISLWEKKENAEAYNRGAYPEVLKAMAKVVEGTPQVQASEVSNSTWHKIAAR